MDELSLEDRIKKEYRRIRRLFRDLPKNELTFIDAQLQNAAFMRITLDDLQKDINIMGAIEEYKNGENQYGSKASAHLQAYNTTVKNYNSLMKELITRLPKEQANSKLEQFLNG